MARRYGRALCGQRLVASVPHGHWKTSTFLAALRQDKVTAPCVIDGAINGELFLAYIEQFPAPTLMPGDIAELKKEIVAKAPNHSRIRTMLGSPKFIFEGATGKVVAQEIILAIQSHFS
jgi:hypothetical protein